MSSAQLWANEDVLYLIVSSLGGLRERMEDGRLFLCLLLLRSTFNIIRFRNYLSTSVDYYHYYYYYHHHYYLLSNVDSDSTLLHHMKICRAIPIQSHCAHSNQPFAISYAVHEIATLGACNATRGNVPRNNPRGPSSCIIDWNASIGVV